MNSVYYVVFKPRCLIIEILQQKTPEDYVIATGKQASVRDFIELCAKELNWGGIQWEGENTNEIGKRKDNGNIVIKIDKKLFRPAEVETLLGDPQKAQRQLGWKPKISLEELVKEMIDQDKKDCS